MLIGLLALSMNVKLDSILVLSGAIYNLIHGLQNIVQGLGHVFHGLGQMLGFMALAALAVTSLVAMASGTIRIGLKLMPQLGSLWSLLAAGLNALIQLMSLPQRPRVEPDRLSGLPTREQDRDTNHRQVA